MSEASRVDIITEPTSRYPEHDKLDQVKGKSQAIHGFLEWVREQGFEFGRTVIERKAVFEGTEDVTVLHPVGERQLKGLLAAHFGIDLAKLEAEKDEMVADMAALNPRSVRR